MNSYPSELLMQLSPVMFVAGLNTVSPAQEQTDTPTSPTTEAPITPSVKKAVDPFVSLTHRLRDVLLSQRRVSIWQPEAGTPAGSVKVFHSVIVDKNFQFPPRKITPPSNPQGTPHSPLSPLMPTSPLHPDGLIAPIWIRKHTALVPSVFVLFVRMWEWEGATSPSVETPLSPLETAIYREDKEVREAKEARQAAERQHDTALSKEIAERKKSTSERGIKLTVVLMASRAMLDDPTLDSRLTYIRRTSGLDARAALFVLSPVAQSELVDFVKSLQQALYEPAIEYYAAHSKRVRRKRNRHAHSTTYTPQPVYQQPLLATGPPPPAPPQPLRPEGWTVRYEYKMACFAEFRGEEEVALKHYQDAYTALLTMFGSNASGVSSPGSMFLIPRTKRWAEAKVLADCINVKIMKLFLCNAEHSLALSQLRTHLSKFMDLSEKAWGIGRDMFEFWGWVARQYRVFAELLELGTHHNLNIPTHLPPLPPVTNPSTQVQPPSQNVAQTDLMGTVTGNGLGFGVNPSTALHHPGFYYLVAAECTERRREKFLDALNEEEKTGVTNQSPGFANEKKVDHLAVVLELYTQAYEVFKKYSAVPPISPVVSMQGLSKSQTLPAQSSTGRFTLLIAHRIAQTYYEAGKYETAIRFFERIARTYRVEHYEALLRPLLRTWCACARKMGDVEMGVKVLVEGVVCGSDGNKSANEEEDLVEDLRAALTSTVPSSSEPLCVEIPSHLPILNSSVTFWPSAVYVNEPAAFQIHLSAPNTIVERISKLPVERVELAFGDEEAGGVIEIKSGGKKDSMVEFVDVGELSYASRVSDTSSRKSAEANLEFTTERIVVVAGRLTKDFPGDVSFLSAALSMVSGEWKINIPFDLNIARGRGPPSHQWYIPNGSGGEENTGKFIPVRKGDASRVTVQHRPHQLYISFSHASPAYLDEQYPICLTVTNLDDRELDIVVDVLLQPGEDDSVNTIELASLSSTGLVKGVSFGALPPGGSVEKTLILHSTGLPGKRLIDFSIQSRFFPDASERTSKQAPSEAYDEDFMAGEDSTSTPLSTLETLQTLSVEVVAPFRISHDVSYRHKRVEPAFSEGDRVGVSSLQTFDRDWWDDRVGGEATVFTEVECTAVASNTMSSDGGDEDEVGLVLDGIKMIRRRDGEHCRVTGCSIEDEEFPIEFLPMDRYAATCELSLAPPEDFFADGEDIPCPGWYEITWKRMSGSAITTTKVSLSSLRPPSKNLTLSALLDVPSIATLHKPLLMSLLLRNNHPTRTACPFVVVEPQGFLQLQQTSSQPTSHTERPGTPTPANVVSSSSATNTSSSPDAFVFSGVRSGRAPILVPGAETRISWTLYPMRCGPSVPLPRVRVFDRREGEAGRVGGGSTDASVMSPGPGTGLDGVSGVNAAEKGEVEVKVLDARWDSARSDGTDILGENGRFTIVVLPA